MHGANRTRTAVNLPGQTNPDCSGSIEELGGSAGNGQYAQDNQTLILDQPAQDYSDTEVAVAEVTPVEESGDTIDMGGSLNAREAEIADAGGQSRKPYGSV